MKSIIYLNASYISNMSIDGQHYLTIEDSILIDFSGLHYHSQSYNTMQPSQPADRRSYDRNGFEKEERETKLMSYLFDRQLQEEREKRWHLLLPKVAALRNSGKEGEKRVINEVREGVFDGLRHKVWPLLIQEPLFKFEDCRDKCENKEINLDLDRTFPTHKEAKLIEQRMKTVLNALVVALPQVGYCQGMNFIVGTILLRLGQENAFKVAYHIFHWQKQEQLLRDLNLIHQQLYALSRIDEEALPTTIPFASGSRDRSNHIRFIMVHNIILQLPACVLRFPYHRELPAGGYAKDELGEKILYRVALQILKWKKRELKSKDKVEDFVEELKNYDQFNEGNVDQFFREMYEIPLSREEIKKYRVEYHTRSPKSKQ